MPQGLRLQGLLDSLDSLLEVLAPDTAFVPLPFGTRHVSGAKDIAAGAAYFTDQEAQLLDELERQYRENAQRSANLKAVVSQQVAGIRQISARCDEIEIEKEVLEREISMILGFVVFHRTVSQKSHDTMESDEMVRTIAEFIDTTCPDVAIGFAEDVFSQAGQDVNSGDDGHSLAGADLAAEDDGAASLVRRRRRRNVNGSIKQRKRRMQKAERLRAEAQASSSAAS